MIGVTHKNVLVLLTLFLVAGYFAKSESDWTRITSLNSGSPFHFTLGFSTIPFDDVETQLLMTLSRAYLWASAVPLGINLNSSLTHLFISGW